MASLFIGNDTDIDYSLIDGHVREFVFNGEIVYSEYKRIDCEGWQNVLAHVIDHCELNSDERRNGNGLHAFVYWMEEHGYL